MGIATAMTSLTPRRGPRIRVAPKEARTYEGRVFHSKGEMLRYQQLLLLLAAGAIRHLECQKAFPLLVKGRLVATYKADFVYDEVTPVGLRPVVEDVTWTKGRKRDDFSLKLKLMLACHGIEVRKVAPPRRV